MSTTPERSPVGQNWQTRPTRERIPGQAMPYSDLGIDVPFLNHLGVQVVPQEDGSMQIMVDLAMYHMNGGMTAHGGVVMTLLDMAMAAAGRFGDPQGRFCVTVEMKCNFMRPARTVGARLMAQGRLRQGGATLAFCDAELRDVDGTVLASASGTFKYAKPQTGGERT